MILETVRVGSFQVNCYILAGDSRCKAIIIDPGDEENKVRKVLNKYKLSPERIINTHGHIDHIGCDDAFGIPVYAHRNEISMLKSQKLNLSEFINFPYSVQSTITPLEDKEKINLDDTIELEVIYTPGHTPGGICVLMIKPEVNILFSGDTLFYQGIGRTDFAGADQSTLIKSIKERLLVLPDDTIVYPGHGPASTIGHEKKHNPFLEYA